jgi:hypothetical protein
MVDLDTESCVLRTDDDDGINLEKGPGIKRHRKLHIIEKKPRRRDVGAAMGDGAGANVVVLLLLPFVCDEDTNCIEGAFIEIKVE